MKFITWDAGIIAGFVILLAYSLLIRKHKALATLVSIYIAYVMASTWGPAVADFFAGNRVVANQVWIRANVSPVLVQALMLFLVTFLISTFLKLGGKRSKYSSIEIVLYALGTMGLFVMFVLSFMTPEARDNTLQTSRLVPLIYHFRDWILVVPVFCMVFFGIYTSEEH